eukprot:1884909-Rhodomonas_salina.1
MVSSALWRLRMIDDQDLKTGHSHILCARTITFSATDRRCSHLAHPLTYLVSWGSWKGDSRRWSARARRYPVRNLLPETASNRSAWDHALFVNCTVVDEVAWMEADRCRRPISSTKQ